MDKVNPMKMSKEKEFLLDLINKRLTDRDVHIFYLEAQLANAGKVIRAARTYCQAGDCNNKYGQAKKQELNEALTDYDDSHAKCKTSNNISMECRTLTEIEADLPDELDSDIIIELEGTGKK